MALTYVGPRHTPEEIRGWMAAVRKAWAAAGCVVERFEARMGRHGVPVLIARGFEA